MKIRLILLLVCLANKHLYAAEITYVYHDKALFDLKTHENVAIHFEVSEESDVTLRIYDDKDFMVREIDKKGLKKGNQSISWDGKDQYGEAVPPEAYHYTIIAKDEITTTEHDLTDYTGGEQYAIDPIKWDVDKKSFKYNLTEPSRVFIRIGLDKSGPLLATVSNWVPRGAGEHLEFWDGMDASKVMHLSKHPKLLIDARAYTLSKNTILVGSATDDNKFVKRYKNKIKRIRKYTHAKKMVAASQLSPDARGDYLAELSLPGTVEVTSNGIPVTKGLVSVMLDVPIDKRDLILQTRSETVIFVDGQFMFEIEVGIMPMTWRLDTSTLNEGEHFITVNLRGYEGSFGIATKMIYVKHEKG